MINTTFLRTYIFCKDLSFRVPNLMLNISLHHHLQYQDKFATFCFCDSKSISLQLIETALQRIALWEFIYLFIETTELSGVRCPAYNVAIQVESSYQIEPNLLYLLTTEKYLSISKVWKV